MNPAADSASAGKKPIDNSSALQCCAALALRAAPDPCNDSGGMAEVGQAMEWLGGDTRRAGVLARYCTFEGCVAEMAGAATSKGIVRPRCVASWAALRAGRTAVRIHDDQQH